MVRQYLTRQELYSLIITTIDQKLKESNRAVSELTIDEFGLCERHYYYLKKNSKGFNGPDVSESKIKEIAKKLGFEIDVRFLKK